MKKILLIHQSAEFYGSDRSFLATLDAIVDSVSHENITVVLPDEGRLAKHIRDRGVKIIFQSAGIIRKSELRHPLLFFLNFLKAVLFYTKEIQRYECVYVNTIVCVGAICALRRYAGMKVVHVREIPGCIDGYVFRNILKFSQAKLFYNSQAAKNSMRLDGAVIYNGVNIHNVSTESLSKEENGGGMLNKILVIGRISAWKGQQFFLDAIRGLNITLSVRIVGSAISGKEYLFEELKRSTLGLCHSIEFFEFVDDPSVHYGWCDYVVVPSIKPEPFGRVAIEAMGNGKPVIVAAHGGLVEIVNDPDVGFLFSPNSEASLCNALKNAVNISLSKYLVMSERARSEYERRFSEERYKTEICQNLFID
jgi:glycosyltransferase involved in cell wall biosynthesis